MVLKLNCLQHASYKSLAGGNFYDEGAETV